MGRSQSADPAHQDDGPMPPLRYELAARAERASRAGGDWSVGHLRIPAWAMVVLAVLGTAIAWPTRGTSAVWGVLLGLAVVAGFFSLSSWVVARAGEVNYRYTMPAALITYGLKFLLLALLLATFPLTGPIDRVWLGATIGVAAMVWIGCQAVVVWRTPMLYVDLSAMESAVPPAATARTAGKDA